MQMEHPDSDTAKASTPSRHLLATALIGAALIGYLVHKTPDARGRLERLAYRAHTEGDLHPRDALVVAQVLARPPVSN